MLTIGELYDSIQEILAAERALSIAEDGLYENCDAYTKQFRNEAFERAKMHLQELRDEPIQLDDRKVPVNYG